MTSENIKRDYESLERGNGILLKAIFNEEPNTPPKSQQERKIWDTIRTLRENLKIAFVDILKNYIETRKEGYKFNEKEYKDVINLFVTLIYIDMKERYERISNDDEFSKIMKAMNFAIRVGMKNMFSYDDVKKIIEKSIN